MHTDLVSQQNSLLTSMFMAVFSAGDLTALCAVLLGTDEITNWAVTTQKDYISLLKHVYRSVNKPAFVICMQQWTG